MGFIKLRLILSLMFLSIPLLSCGQPKDSSLHWAHFAELDNGFDPKTFLYGLEKSQVLNVCLSGRVPNKIDVSELHAEIFTAVHVWSQSIGRYIPMNFGNCEQKPALRIVFDRAPVAGDFVGYTDFQEERRVFLNPEYDWVSTGSVLGLDRQPNWKNLSWQAKARFIFPLIADSAYTPFPLPSAGGRNPQHTLAILMHELGHAWGLCDLYEDKEGRLGFNSNCSKLFRSANPLPSEIMTAATKPGTAQFAISAADRSGLQALIERKGFPVSKGWSARPAALANEALLASALGAASPDPSSGAGLESIVIKGSPLVKVLPGESSVLVTLKVLSPRGVASVFIYEERGQGPFATLTQAKQGPDGLEFEAQLAISAEDLPLSLSYRASASGLTSSPFALELISGGTAARP